MKSLALFALSLCFAIQISGQSNYVITNPAVEAVFFGNFSPNDYAQANPINAPGVIAEGLVQGISPDSLRAYLLEMAAFGNRNSGSDTVSNTFGIGAARRWAFDKFQSFSAAEENRLLVSYFQFDQMICGMGQHRDIMAVLPGVGPQRDELVLVEGHFDSRCEDGCDINCTAEGMEDNGSGSALVLELARVMSHYSFNRTIVFLLTIAEEQGLYGADALAFYCQDQNIKINAVLNNDIVGGVICGNTASPPGCPGLNAVDSINVRLYSSGTLNSRHKQLARYTKLEYHENVRDLMPIKPVVNIMTPEDREGRGGDHIPFRQRGYTAIRMTSANEHGDGNPSQAGYSDRQHTMFDVLGLDTNSDGALDSFFVDFNYLARNAVINGNALASAAMGPIAIPTFTLASIPGGFSVSFTDDNNYGTYRVGVREFTTYDWDSVYTIHQTTDSIYGLTPGAIYVLSVASVDENGIESLFSQEKFASLTTDVQEVELAEKGLMLLQNHPNPFDEATTIGVLVNRSLDYRTAYIAFQDLQGKELTRLPITLHQGMNDVVYGYQHHDYVPGIYLYSLVVDGQVVDTKRMVYAW